MNRLGRFGRVYIWFNAVQCCASAEMKDEKISKRKKRGSEAPELIECSYDIDGIDRGMSHFHYYTEYIYILSASTWLPAQFMRHVSIVRMIMKQEDLE